MAGFGHIDPAAFAECNLLGCILLHSETCAEVFDIVTAEMFDYSDARKIYTACYAEHLAGHKIDPMTIIDKTGLKEATLMCADSMQNKNRAAEYAEIVRDNWRKRSMAATLQDIAADASTPGIMAKDMVTQLDALTEHQKALERAITEDSAKPFIKRLVEWMASLSKPKTSIKTGFHHFDLILGGFERGGLYSISARPGAGKTDFSLHLAAKLAKHNRVYYCTMEMPAGQCIERIVSNATRINSGKMRERTLTPEELQDIAMTMEIMCKNPLIVDDAPALSAADVKAKIIKQRPDIIFVDNLQLMAALSSKRQQHEVYAETTGMLKQIALKYKIVIVLLVQESRDADKGAAPTLSGLRGSAAIESDSDGVIFIRNKRPDHFLQGDECVETKMYIEKNRHGGTGQCHFLWQPQYHRYIETDRRGEG